MRILVLGGSKFVGWHMVQEAVARGHEVTLFNRGISGGGAWPDLPQIHGDRGTDLHLLDGLTFDAVIDSSCWYQDHMRASAAYFAGKVKWYVYVSTLSVHDTAPEVIREDDPLPEIDLEGPQDPDSMYARYGAYKAGCEVIAQEAFGDQLTILRPGYICGYRDGTDRMSSWPIRMHFGDAVIYPEGDFPFQLIDARDLAAFCLDAVEKRLNGPYIMVGPAEKLMFSEFLDICRRTVKPECRLLPLSPEALARHGLDSPGALAGTFPLYSRGFPQYAGIFGGDNRKALTAGLKCRPIAETAEAALRGFLERGDPAPVVGITPEREAEIVAAEGL